MQEGWWRVDEQGAGGAAALRGRRGCWSGCFQARWGAAELALGLQIAGAGHGGQGAWLRAADPRARAAEVVLALRAGALAVLRRARGGHRQHSHPPEARSVYGYLRHLCMWTSACVCMLSCFSHFRLFAILWAVACQAPLSMEVSRQEYWSGCHSLLQGIFPIQESNMGLLCYKQGGDKYFLLSVLTLEVIVLFNSFL